MRLFLYPLLWVTTAIIVLCGCFGASFEYLASRLVPVQRFLSNKIEEQSS
jgi:hypothetical protein